MRIFFDLDNQRRISGLRGATFSTPLPFITPSTGTLEVYFVRNGEQVLPAATSLVFKALPRDPKSGTVLFETSGFTSVLASKKILVPFNTSSAELEEQFDPSNWVSAVSDGSSKTYEFAPSKFSAAIHRARGFQVRLGASGPYAAPGSFTINPAARTVTLVTAEVPAASQVLTFDAFIPELTCRGEITLTEVSAITLTGDTTASSINVTNTDTSLLFVGAPVSGAGISGGTVVASVVSGTAFTLSNPATATATGVSLTTQGNTITTAVFPVSIFERLN
jgi:hypothetical protein